MTAENRWFEKPKGIREETAAGGVVAQIKNGAARVALLKEGGEKKYCLPKGKVEKGETLEEAAKREIFEEAGIDGLRLVSKLGVEERLNFKKTAWKTTHYFLFTVDGDFPKRGKHEFELEWFPVDRLPPMFWPEQEKITRAAGPKIQELNKALSKA